MIKLSSPRPIGVAVNSRVEDAPVQKLVACEKAEFFAVRFGDSHGQAHTALVLRMGDDWYMPPNSEEYAASLRPCAEWLRKQLSAKAPVQTAALPKTDDVEVL